MKVPVAYGGGMQQRLFESGYLGYASFVDIMDDDQWLFTLTDPYEDFGGDDWDFYRDCYAQQVVAQLMQQDIHRFQETIWVSRSFSSDVPMDYRTMQLGVFNAMNELAGQESTLYAGTPGISVGLSDSLAWQYGAQHQPTESTANGFYGMTIPLVERGIPLSITSLDRLASIDDLKDVRVLLLSYDCMKPMSEEVNRILAQWVREGGVLLYLGGHDAFESADNQWWSALGQTPLENLLGHLEVDVAVGRSAEAYNGFSWCGDENYGAGLQSLFLEENYGSYAATFSGNGFEPILDSEGAAMGIDCPAGKGRLIAVGLPSSFYSSTSAGPVMVRSLTEYAVQYSGYQYVESDLMTVRRGNVIATHATSMSQPMEGNFVDLLDATLPVIQSKTVEANQSSLLYDITDRMTQGTPRLAFTSGTLEGETIETADKTSFRITGPDMTPVSVRILGNGRTPKQVQIQKDGAAFSRADYGWDNGTGSLLLSMITQPDEPIDVEILWGDDEVPDKDCPQYDSITVMTNESNADAEYIVRNSGAANSAMRYCDGAAELVYRIDLDRFRDAILSLKVINNYVIGISDHDGDYRTIFDYSDISDERAQGENLTYLNFDPKEYGIEQGPLYLKLSNTDPTKGHGGAIYYFSVQYKK